MCQRGTTKRLNLLEKFYSFTPYVTQPPLKILLGIMIERAIFNLTFLHTEHTTDFLNINH